MILTKNSLRAILTPIVVYVATLAAAAAFYLWVTQLPSDQPPFLLRPIAAITGFFSGDTYTYQKGLGYWTIAANGAEMVIEKSCSSANFLILCFSMLVFTHRWRPGRPLRQAAVYLGMLLFSYLCAIVAAAFRIVTTVFLLGAGLAISRSLLHNAIGIITYIFMICLSYWATHKITAAIQASEVVEQHG